MLDWNAAWRTWCRNAIRFAGKNGRVGAKQPDGIVATLRGLRLPGRRSSGRYSDEWGYERHFDGYTIAIGDDVGSADLHRVIADIEATMRPLPAKDIKLALAKLRVSTASRSASGEDLAFIVATFAEWLAEYPADAVLSGIENWRKTQKFWPTEAELRADIEERTYRRVALIAALKNPQRPAPVVDQRETPPLTDEDIAAIYQKHGVPRPKPSPKELPRQECDISASLRRAYAALQSFKLPDSVP